jgi:hypothetical protein
MNEQNQIVMHCITFHFVRKNIIRVFSLFNPISWCSFQMMWFWLTKVSSSSRKSWFFVPGIVQVWVPWPECPSISWMFISPASSQIRSQSQITQANRRNTSLKSISKTNKSNQLLQSVTEINHFSQLVKQITIVNRRSISPLQISEVNRRSESLKQSTRVNPAI